MEREALAGFLERIQKAEEVTAVFDQVREEKAAASGKKLRTLVQKDDEPVSLTSLPSSLTLARGHLELNFQTLEELAEAMYFVARAMDCDLEAFADRYQPLPEKG